MPNCPRQARACCMLATRLPWVSIAPLARPVVPPVYCSTAMSSRPAFSGLMPRPRPRRSALLKETAWGKA
ncbi:hypothetical protein D3C84_1018450 [compost metagenome]